MPTPDAKARFLNPRSLKPPRVHKPEISPHTSEAVMWALEMHPDERPGSIEGFREVLSGREKRPGKRGGLTAENSFSDAVKQNRLPALLALLLFILAIILTIL
jgi:serine/threonine-protein kinase